MVVGVLAGVFYGYNIDESSFKLGMAIIILFSTVLMYYWEQKKSKKIPTHWSFVGSLGMAAGFTTMIGNLAGTISNIYFLAQRLPKNQFIGTAAWLFFIINIFKMPFHILVWNTIQLESLKTSLTLLPFVGVGLYIGIKLINLIHENTYRKLILIFTAIGALVILLRQA